MKVVVCGSYGDFEGFLEVLLSYQEKYGPSNVFPNKEHMEKSVPCILAHHIMEKETETTIAARAKLMESYFSNIDSADLIVVNNEKNGNEYYGTGTTLELGYAFARGKRICFTRRPTDSNILSLMKTSSERTPEVDRTEAICTT